MHKVLQLTFWILLSLTDRRGQKIPMNCQTKTRCRSRVSTNVSDQKTRKSIRSQAIKENKKPISPTTTTTMVDKSESKSSQNDHPPRRMTRGTKSLLTEIVPESPSKKLKFTKLEEEDYSVTENVMLSEKDQKEALKRQKASNYFKSYDPNVLLNLNFVLTGALSLVRDNVITIIHKHGGYVQSKVDEHTDYVVMGERVGNNKTGKAKQLNTPTISEDELFKMLRGGKDVSLTDPDTIPRAGGCSNITFRPKRRRIKAKLEEWELDEDEDNDFDDDDNFHNDDDGWDEEGDDLEIATIIQGWGRELALMYLIQNYLADSNVT